MDAARDLACPDLWQQSLERSLARRGRPTRSSLELFRLRPERDLSAGDFLRESLMFSQLRRSAVERRPAMSLPGAGGISALALLAATTVPGLIGGRSGASHSERVAFRPGGRGARGSAGSPRTSFSKAAVGLAISPSLADQAAALDRAAAAGSVAGRHITQDAKPSAVTHPKSSPAPPTHRPAAPTVHAHLAAEHDATGGAQRSAGVAHAHSGGAVAGAPRTAAIAPRVPGSPQPAGHPSTGGGAIEETSHSSVSATHATTPAVSVHPVTASHPVTATKPATTPATATHPVTTTHPVAKPHPVSTSHPVATSHPAPTPPTPAAPVASGGYTNPLASASVTPERIDQGVDYGGSGTLTALGDGKVTYVGTSGTGWPGAFVEFQLSSGPDAGRYVYYAESISPASGLQVGQTVHAGQPIASINGQIEIGWGSGVGTQPAAQADGQWSSGSDSANAATPDGKSFSGLIASLGGPPGKVEG